MICSVPPLVLVAVLRAGLRTARHTNQEDPVHAIPS